MKKMYIAVLLLLSVHMIWGQKMQIYTSTQGKIEIVLSSIDSITFTSGNGFAVSPNYIYVAPTATMGATISGGKTPYSIQSDPNNSIATAYISGNMLYVYGVTPGSTSLVVKDNSSPPLTATAYIYVTGGTGLTATPSDLSVQAGQQQTSTIGGGTTPYSILYTPNASVATASISGNLLTVQGVAGGSTSVTVKDNSSPYKSVTVYISVRGVFTSPGSISFSSTAGNFSATGTFDNSDTIPSNLQAAGGLLYEDSGGGDLSVIGYYVNSPTNWDVVLVEFMDSVSLASGSFPFQFTSVPAKRAIFYFAKGWNPVTSEDPFVVGGYFLFTGTANLSSFSSASAQGTFAGTGYVISGSTPDFTKPITVTGGTFAVPVVSEGRASLGDREKLQRLSARMKGSFPK